MARQAVYCIAMLSVRAGVRTRSGADGERADAQKKPPKPDHGSAGQAISRCCLYARAFGLEARAGTQDPPKPDHGSAGQAASRCCLYAQLFRLEAALAGRAPVRKTRRSPIMARQVRLYRDAVCTRGRSDSKRAPVRKTRRSPIMARQVRLHRDAVFTRRRSDSKRAQKMRNNCRRLDARAGVCCANEHEQSNRKNTLRGKAAAYSRRGPCHCAPCPRRAGRKRLSRPSQSGRVSSCA